MYTNINTPKNHAPPPAYAIYGAPEATDTLYLTSYFSDTLAAIHAVGASVYVPNPAHQPFIAEKLKNRFPSKKVIGLCWFNQPKPGNSYDPETNREAVDKERDSEETLKTVYGEGVQ